jgi:uncharacterized protein YaiI (UPF0178 family)
MGDPANTIDSDACNITDEMIQGVSDSITNTYNNFIKSMNSVNIQYTTATPTVPSAPIEGSYLNFVSPSPSYNPLISPPYISQLINQRLDIANLRTQINNCVAQYKVLSVDYSPSNNLDTEDELAKSDIMLAESLVTKNGLIINRIKYIIGIIILSVFFVYIQRNKIKLNTNV